MYSALASFVAQPAVLLVLGVALATGGYVVGDQSSFKVDAPTWAVGDTWHYTASFSIEGMAYDPEGNEAGSFEEFESMDLWMRVVDDTGSLGETPVYGVQFSEDGELWDGQEVLTRADLNPIMPTYSVSCEKSTRGDVEGYPGRGRADPPKCMPVLDGIHEVELFNFPLHPDRSWRITPPDNFANFTARVGDQGDITVPAGTMSAYRIRANLEEVNDPELKAFLDNSDVTWGISYWYSPEVKWISRVEVWAEGTDPRGHGEGRMDFVMELVEFTRTEIERDPAPGTTTTVVAPDRDDARTLAIDASDHVVNAADAPEVVLRAVATGMPESAMFSWTIGDEVLWGEEATVVIDEPGFHEIRLEAITDEGVLATAEDLIVGNYETTITGRGMPGMGDEHVLPVASTPSWITLTYEAPSGGIFWDATDDLSLVDAAGVTMAQGSHIEMGDEDDLHNYPVGEWLAVVDIDADEVDAGAYMLDVGIYWTHPGPGRAATWEGAGVETWGMIMPGLLPGSTEELHRAVRVLDAWI